MERVVVDGDQIRDHFLAEAVAEEAAVFQNGAGGEAHGREHSDQSSHRRLLQDHRILTRRRAIRFSERAAFSRGPSCHLFGMEIGDAGARELRVA
jgi:hypothetical protein